MHRKRIVQRRSILCGGFEGSRQADKRNAELSAQFRYGHCQMLLRANLFVADQEPLASTPIRRVLRIDVRGRWYEQNRWGDVVLDTEFSKSRKQHSDLLPVLCPLYGIGILGRYTIDEHHWKYRLIRKANPRQITSEGMRD